MQKCILLLLVSITQQVSLMAVHSPSLLHSQSKPHVSRLSQLFSSIKNATLGITVNTKDTQVGIDMPSTKPSALNDTDWSKLKNASQELSKVNDLQDATEKKQAVNAVSSLSPWAILSKNATVDVDTAKSNPVTVDESNSLPTKSMT